MTEKQQELRRVQCIEVEGLFGLYDHQIHLKPEGVTLLHGPNGVGKTSVLRMTDALLRGSLGSLAYFRGVPYRRFSLGFQDGAVLTLTPGVDEDDPALELTVNDKIESDTINFGALDRAVQVAMQVARKVGYLQREGEDIWIDSRYGELLSSTEVIRRYDDPLIADHLEGHDLPWLGTFLEGVNSHLIEAQRLERMRRGRSPSNRTRESVSTPIVNECSRDLKRRIDQTVGEYGRQAQELDKSFPHRLLQRTAEALSVEEIRDRMTALDSTTEELKSIGILDVLPTNPSEIGDNIDDTQRGVMTLYLEDTAKKHEAARHLARKIRPLLDDLNGKFRHKTVAVDRDRGLVAKDKHGRPLPLTSLSSGEQHELVLQYELLFKIEPNALVLLDEPEISLHVEWQRTFLADLKQMAKLSGFDALVATHSPYIVGDDDRLMVGLGGD